MPELSGLILAGGLGSRLAADGVPEAKPLVRVGGVPQVVRLARALRTAGCTDLVCMVRDDLAEQVQTALDESEVGARVLPCRTPSSLHTLVEGVTAVGDTPLLCTMVDTCMEESDWAAVGARAARGSAAGEALLLVVTPFAGDDERPLYVDVDESGRVHRVGEVPGARALITGGVYALTPEAGRLAQDCLERGMSRMRSFLAHAAPRIRVGAIEIGRMIDIDHRADLDAAERWLAGSPEQE